MPPDHLATGRTGEEIAVRFLEEKGHRIIETNFWTSAAEIDIITTNKDVYCFIEVKTRRNISKALPRQAVNYRKQQKIIMGAHLFLKKYKLFKTRFRFDVIEVVLDDPPCINHIENAFRG